ncbi:MAG: hotdog fold thioesterase [Saprospiraceae bacterium]|nr:hotdog fold thioesterase [Saprospiraceae bacterium]
MSNNIWTIRPDPDTLNANRRGTMLEHLDILITEVTDTSITGSMPVDHRTVQPYGILHGGASATLAESVASLASSLVVAEPGKQKVVGIELNINHLRQATSGHVHATAKPVKLGRRLHVWQIDIHDDAGKQVSAARLTVIVI